MNHLPQFREIVQSNADLMQALRTLRNMELPDAYIGAGAVRGAVRDVLHGHARPTPPSDIDVIFFDAPDCSRERDLTIQAQLSLRLPSLPWDVTNQAGVHLWYAQYFGTEVAPLLSIEDAVASWPETATAIAVRLDAQDQLQVIAPFGLSDLFRMIVRWNPARVSLEQYRLRLEQKQYRRRWPKVQVLPG